MILKLNQNVKFGRPIGIAYRGTIFGQKEELPLEVRAEFDAHPEHFEVIDDRKPVEFAELEIITKEEAMSEEPGETGKKEATTSKPTPKRKTK